MKTKLFVIFSILISLFTSILGFTTANWNSSPVNVLDDLKTDVQQTALDNAVDISTKWVTSTLTAIKQSSGGYLQWISYIWLGIALILIVYNGKMLIVSSLTGSDEISKFKKRFVSLILWVVVLTSGYLIIKFIVSMIWELF